MNQDGPSLIIEPPHPPGPQVSKDVNVFTYEKRIISRHAVGPGTGYITTPPVGLSNQIKSNQIKCFLLAYMIYIILTKEHIYINKYIYK